MKNQILFYTSEIKSVANKGFFYLLTAQGFIYIIGFFSQFFVAGFLDPTDIGRIKIMQTYINLSALICGVGFDTSLLKLASENRDESEKKNLYQVAFLVTVIAFVFIYIVLYLMSHFGMVSSDPVISRIFPIYMFFLLPLALQSIQLAYYQARRKVKLMAQLQLIVKLISILFIVLFTYFFKLEGYVITIILTAFLGMIIFEMGINNINFQTNVFKIDLNIFKKMWHLAGLALITNIIGMITATIDIYLINYLVTDRKEVGYYMFALTILSVYQLLPLTIQQVAIPFFSEQSANHEKWYSSYLKYNKMNHILVVLVVAGGMLILPFLIKLSFAGKYDRSIYYFLLLSISWLIKYSSMMKGTAIMGYGRFDINFLASVIILVLTFPVIFVFIKFYGLTGAVMGMFSGAIITYTISFHIFRWFNKKLRNQL